MSATTYDPELTARLIAEAREDDGAMSDESDGIWVAGFGIGEDLSAVQLFDGDGRPASVVRRNPGETYDDFIRRTMETIGFKVSW